MKNKSFIKLFEDQVKLTPHKVAISFLSEKLTYLELNAKANQLAHHLHTNFKVKPDTIIPVIMNRSPEMIITLLGILKSGSAYLPIDPNLPKKRIKYMLEDARASLLLTHSYLLNNIQLSMTLKNNITYILLDADRENLSKQPTSNIEKNINENDLAYVIYTSGSTGNPKGVLIEHGNLLNFLFAINEHIDVNEKDVFLAITAYTFDISILEFFLPLIHGACLVIAPDNLISDPRSVSTIINQHKVSIVQATPAMWQLLLDANLDNPSLKILCGGEALSATLANKLLSKVPCFWNVYGPTETTIWTTISKIQAADLPDSITIGKSLRNTNIYVFDSELNPVEVGRVGELFIGGKGVARGYLNRPELNNEKFILYNNSRLYRTGDLVRQLINGNLEFIGRNDDQVKISGYRIEMGEIEMQLNRHPKISQSVVLAKKEEDSHRLIAFVILKRSIESTSDEFYDFLKRILPDYMIPHAFTILDKIPLTSSGKVDKKSLLSSKVSFLNSARNHVSPTSNEEKILVNIWSSLLKLDADLVGITDNFFLLGGHSLLAAQVVSRINAAFNKNILISDLFKYPTISSLIKYIQESKAPSFQPILKHVPQSEKKPLSFSQERMIFLDRLQPNKAIYNLTSALKIHGLLNVAALERAFLNVFLRHEILRTSFGFNDDGLFQQITPKDKFCFSLPVEKIPLKKIEETLLVEANKPFELSEGPLIRVRLFEVDAQYYILVVTMHHAISDDWSNAILKQELNDLYLAEITKKVLLPPLSFQYADYAYSTRQWAESDVLKNQLSYWESQLAELSTLELPLSYARPVKQTYNGRTLSIALPRSLCQQVKYFSLKQSVTLFNTLFSIFAILLSRYANQLDILVGTPIAGRVNEKLENMIGLFVNTVVLRSDLSGLPDFITALHRNHKMTLAAYDHQDAPFDQVVHRLKINKEINRHPLFQTMFVFQNAPQHVWHLPDIQITPIHVDKKSAQFDLTLILGEEDGQIKGGIEFNTDLFSQNFIELFWQHYLTLLQHLLNEPKKAVSHVSFLMPEEYESLIMNWSGANVCRPIHKTLHQLFEEQVEKTPNHVALTFQGQALTYLELNRKANQLANYLRAHYRVQPDQLIPIILNRSFEMIIGVLGIIKSGAAYVPIDSTYPTKRIQYMLQDANAALIITKKALLDKNIALPSLLLDEHWPDIEKLSGSNLTPLSQPFHLAYVIYTSGSTGQPKGVMIQHGGIVNTISAQIDAWQINSNSKILQFASFSFDSAVSETYRALLSGATLALNEQEKIMPGAVLATLLDEQKITVVTLPPAALSLMPVKRYTTLETIITAGEACSAELMNKWSSSYRCINAYGPTEISICATMSVCVQSENKPSIGKPLMNVEAYVLDPFLQPVPKGVVGELYIGGPGVARGYVNQPELTRERFIINPFKKENASRIYKTGDMVRWLDDGNLEFLGRIDDQVKIRGFRVELGEIEKKLLSHPNVTQCTVLVKTIQDDKKIIAYLVCHDKQSLSVNALRDFLGKHLPVYMIPNAFLMLDEMPMTVNRKIDKKSLMALEVSAFKDERTYQYPRNEIEFKLVMLWESILNVSPVSVKDNFFELGGHSLLLVNLAMQMEKLFNKKVPVSLIFDMPTIEELASFLARKHDYDVNVIVKLREEGSKPPLYLMHETNGLAFSYLALSRHFNNDRPIYALQDPSMGKGVSFVSLEDMAAHYVAVIKKVQPEGPYYMGGWCFGGVLAYEMAQQFTQHGDVVNSVILIDSPMDAGKKKQTKSLLEELQALKVVMIEKELGLSAATLEGMDSKIEKMAEEVMHRIVLLRNYSPSFYDGAVTLIKAEEKMPEMDMLVPDKDDSWLPFVSQLKCHLTAGNHLSMMKEPYVGNLAALIERVMNDDC